MSNRRFEGKTAIITGASRGIGAATARLLAAEGANVVLAARSVDALDALRAEIEAAGGTALAMAVDVVETDQLERLVAESQGAFGDIHVLVNNAGVLPEAKRSEKIPLVEWERILRINLTAPWLLATLCQPSMAAAGGGVVVNVTSSASLYPSVGLSAYNASKVGLNMVSKGLALEWARHGIRVVAIAPGKVDTDLGQPVIDYTERMGLPMNPLGRVGHPDEVAELIAYVASDAASFMTGSVITFDGGEVAATGADQGR